MDSNSSQSGRTRGGGHKLQEGKFQVGKRFFTVIIVKLLNRCPDGLWDPYLQIFSKLY